MAGSKKPSTTAPIPDGWQWAQLGDIADVAFSGVDKRTVEGELPVQLCNYIDVFYNRRISSGMDLMNATATASEMDRWTLRMGDVLFTKDSETPDEIGIPAFVADDMPGVLCGYHLGLARPRKKIVDGAFLAEALTSSDSRKRFSRIANGVTRFGLTLDATKALPILLPPLPEQRAIAAVLDSIDDAIEGAEAVIAAIEGLRDALLHDLLTHGLPGKHTEFRDFPGLGTIPADWEVVRLGDVADVMMGQSPSGSHCNRAGEGVPLLNGPTEYGPDHPEPAQWTTDARKMSREGDVLFCVRGATAGRMNWADRDYAIGRGVAAIRHKSGFSFQRFLRAVVDYYLPKLLSVVTGSTFPNLSYDQITQLQVPGIPLAEQQAIATALEGVDAAIEVARAEREGLRLMKESTVDALLAGRVRVVGFQESVE